MLYIKKFLYAAKNLIFSNKTIEKPIFIKDFSEENNLLIDLINLHANISSYKKDLILKDMKLLRYGILGEKKIYFQLKNSFVPMLGLHDIRLKCNDYVAQIDFLILTNKYIYVLESKNLYGDIKVTADGNFIRIIKDNNENVHKQGMDSPIIQNQRHVNIVKELLKANNIHLPVPIKSFVVFTNSKSLIYKDKSSKKIRQALIKYDQICNILELDLKKDSDYFMNNKEMYFLANFFKKNNVEIKYNLEDKYKISHRDYNKNLNSPSIDLKLYKELKKYRYAISKKDNVPPYYIFKDSQLDLLVSLKPKTKKDLITIYGDNDKRIYLYGDKLIEIISSYSA